MIIPRLVILVLVGIVIGLAACQPFATPLPLPTNTPPPPTATSTPTIVWFPPTPTYTSFPTQTSVLTPTVEIRPEYGELMLEDDFSDPALWSLGKTGEGSVALGLNELTIAISAARGSLYSLRQGTELRDYYAEIVASPSICRGDDEYGVLLRVSPAFDFYRYSLTCNGQVRLDKYFNGRASSPQAPLYSAQVPPGAPSTSRLGVWVVGPELNFYINNVFQFSVRDPSLNSGTIGLFVRAAGDDAVTVNFSNLRVYSARP